LQQQELQLYELLADVLFLVDVLLLLLHDDHHAHWLQVFFQLLQYSLAQLKTISNSENS